MSVAGVDFDRGGVALAGSEGVLFGTLDVENYPDVLSRVLDDPWGSLSGGRYSLGEYEKVGRPIFIFRYAPDSNSKTTSWDSASTIKFHLFHGSNVVYFTVPSIGNILGAHRTSLNTDRKLIQEKNLSPEETAIFAYNRALRKEFDKVENKISDRWKKILRKTSRLTDEFWDTNYENDNELEKALEHEAKTLALNTKAPASTKDQVDYVYANNEEVYMHYNMTHDMSLIKDMWHATVHDPGYLELLIANPVVAVNISGIDNGRVNPCPPGSNLYCGRDFLDKKINFRINRSEELEIIFVFRAENEWDQDYATCAKPGGYKICTYTPPTGGNSCKFYYMEGTMVFSPWSG